MLLLLLHTGTREVERSALVNEEIVYFIFQLELDAQLQRALNYEAYEAAQQIRSKRETVRWSVGVSGEGVLLSLCVCVCVCVGGGLRRLLHSRGVSSRPAATEKRRGSGRGWGRGHAVLLLERTWEGGGAAALKHEA
jgi:hypothetical protein